MKHVHPETKIHTAQEVEIWNVQHYWHVSIPRILGSDTRLSLRALGLLVYFLSRSTDGRHAVTIDSVINNYADSGEKENRQSILSAFQELKNWGYVYKISYRKKGSRKNIMTKWGVCEAPKQKNKVLEI